KRSGASKAKPKPSSLFPSSFPSPPPLPLDFKHPAHPSGPYSPSHTQSAPRTHAAPMETAAAVSVPRSACRAALPFPAPLKLQGRVALPRRALPGAPRQRLVARCAAADDSAAAAELPIEKRVIEYKAGEYAVAIKNVTINDNFFPGHFPERPIMPGVLMVEAMAQVGGIVMLQPEVGGSQDNFFFAGVDKVRFRKPVIAGDTLVMRMTLTKYQKKFGLAKMEGKAYVGGDVVCEGEFLLISATG
uniref:Beta-hydroxyacyl-ACP dehydratase n=1 Tax=Aegilops tauschii subsp. strangulata TaxID=200361 RepID=A0A453CI40_AEGTS